jgi:hypothetical protein
MNNNTSAVQEAYLITGDMLNKLLNYDKNKSDQLKQMTDIAKSTDMNPMQKKFTYSQLYNRFLESEAQMNRPLVIKENLNQPEQSLQPLDSEKNLKTAALIKSLADNNVDDSDSDDNEIHKATETQKEMEVDDEFNYFGDDEASKALKSPEKVINNDDNESNSVSKKLMKKRISPKLKVKRSPTLDYSKMGAQFLDRLKKDKQFEVNRYDRVMINNKEIGPHTVYQYLNLYKSRKSEEAKDKTEGFRAFKQFVDKLLNKGVGKGWLKYEFI